MNQRFRNLEVSGHRYVLALLAVLLCALLGYTVVPLTVRDYQPYASLDFAADNGLMANIRPDPDPEYLDPELLVIFMGAEACGLSAADEMREVVATALTSAKEHARHEGMSAVLVGVALDDAPIQGATYLNQVGSFDEMVLGRGWRNFLTMTALKGPFGGPLLTPQILIVERHTMPLAEGRPARLALRHWVVGTANLRRWSSRGAPIPRGSGDTPHDSDVQ